MSSEKTYKLEFLVRADNWQEVVDTFKNELDVSKEKQDESVRNIQDYFIVGTSLNENKLTEEFYNKILTSEQLALIRDEYSESLQDKIFQNVCEVETELRKLLLHVSDLVEFYFEHFKKIRTSKQVEQFVNHETSITSNHLDPITSYLTLEDTIIIFNQDLSTWSGQYLTADQVLELLEQNDDLASMREYLHEKIQMNPVWDMVSKHVLDSQVSWDQIRPKLEELNKIRNKAAHHRIITKKDLTKAESINKEVTRKIKQQKELTFTSSAVLRKELSPYINKDLFKQLAEIQKTFSEQTDYYNQITQQMAKTIDIENLNMIADNLFKVGRMFESYGFDSNGHPEDGELDEGNENITDFWTEDEYPEDRDNKDHDEDENE